MSVGAEEGACSGDVERRRRKPQLVCAISGSTHEGSSHITLNRVMSASLDWRRLTRKCWRWR
jgi:hypothetical protein